MLAGVVDLGLWALAFCLLGGIGGGFVNSVAGGGTLVTFPMLTAVGISPLDANITTAVALSPGYAGCTYAQRRHFMGRRDLARIDTMVTVVDAANLLKDYSSADFLNDRGESLGEGDQRPVVQLLVDQIEFSDVIVLNKTDAVAPGELETVRNLVRALNPDADIIESSFSSVPLDRVMGTGRFDFEKAQEHPLWAKELYGFANHVPETDTYGIESFVYRSRRPFEPAKIHAFFNEAWPNVVRAKGFFWVATRPDWIGEVSQAGALVRHQGMGRWWAVTPRERWPGSGDFEAYMAGIWDRDVGDRRQEIVFIGIGMDEAALRKRLNACLTDIRHGSTPERMRARTDLHDPFPAWGQTQAA